MSMIPRFLRKRFNNETQFFYLIAGLVAFTAALLALWIGLRQSVWFDEAYSIMIAKQPIAELIRLTSVDAHPPLYYLTLKAWASLFGWSEAALRTMNVLFYGGAIFTAGSAVKRMFGARAAVSALLFVVLAPLIMRYGFEIRMYAMGMFIAAASTYAIVRAIQAHGSKAGYYWWVGYGLLVAAGMYTMYYMALIFAAHFVWLIWRCYHERQKLFRQKWWLVYIGAVVVYLPWLPVALQQIGGGALASVTRAMDINSLLNIASFNFLYKPTWMLGVVSSLVLLFVIVASLKVMQRAWSITKRKEYFMLMIMLFVVPIVIFMAVTIAKPVYLERYIAQASLFGMMLLGISVWVVEQHKPSRLLKYSSALLMVVMLVGFLELVNVGNFNYERMEKPQMKQAASYMQDCKKGTSIVTDDPYLAIELQYYVPQCVIHFNSYNRIMSGGYAPLSDSEFWVDTSVPQLGSTLVYVYYDEPKLKINEAYVPTERKTFNTLKIQEYKVE